MKRSPPILDRLKGPIPPALRKKIRNIVRPSAKPRKIIFPELCPRTKYEPDSIEIREARPEEYATLGRIWGDALVNEGYFPPDFIEWLQDARARALEGTVFTAVYDKTTILGGVMISTWPTPVNRVTNPEEAEVRILGIVPSARGSRIGYRLMQEAIALAWECRKSAVVLWTDVNMLDARHLYERLGFFRTPERDWSNPANQRFVAYRLEPQTAGRTFVGAGLGAAKENSSDGPS
ncbi:MAG: GNAT family N-acetyltransferase [Candidatus Eremiobacteraeota bacterium]|nr:GNAT family N-acetyltransferase [Candidatus Eremiobacteraeota bacterium]